MAWTQKEESMNCSNDTDKQGRGSKEPFIWEPLNAQEAFFSHLDQLGIELTKSGMEPTVTISVRFTDLEPTGDFIQTRYQIKAGGVPVAEEAHGEREASLAMLGFARGLRSIRSTFSRG
jgi:hypothetical protein